MFIGGQLGTLLKGRDKVWSVVDLGSFRETIWDMCWFKDRLFIAGANSLLAMDSSGAIQPVNVGLSHHRTFGQLATNGSVLWSIGQKHIAYTTDGAHWNSVACMDGRH